MREVGDTGVQTHFTAFEEYLTKNDKSVEIITPYNSPQWLVYPVFAFRKLLPYFSSTLNVWWYRHWHKHFLYLSLRHRLLNGQPCTIYAQCPLSVDAALKAKRNTKQKIILVVHFNVSQALEWVDQANIKKDGWLFKSIDDFEKKIIPRVDGIVFVSKFMKDQLEKRIPHIGVVPSAIIPNFVRAPDVANVNDIPKKVIGDLICIGTLENRKNQAYAIHVLAEIKRKGLDLNLTFVGGGSDLTVLKKLAIELGVADRIIFLGYLKNASQLLPQYRACIHVAKIENLPITLIEALSHSKPIFATAVGGVPELFNNSIEGYFIPLDSPREAAEIILNVFADEDVFRIMETAAFERFTQFYEEKLVALRLKAFISSV
jgi:glycosyltransferase involved in cell wall biosynthesis